MVAEERVGRYAATTKSPAAILRPHRVYGEMPPTGLASLLLSGAGSLFSGARAYTTATHVENAALAVVRAADALLASDADAPACAVKTLVTDGATFTVSYLVACAAGVLRCPPPLLPLLTTLGAPLLSVGFPALSSLVTTHQVSANRRNMRLYTS